MNQEYVIIENGGIGYRIFTSGSTIANMPQINENVMLYTQQIVREDFIGLYGFLTNDEIKMFNLLLSVNGIGAKASLSLLSISNVNNLKYAILTADEKTLMRAPGIGKKTAQRIILELKDKLKNDTYVIHNKNDLDKDLQQNKNEALSALISLGYSEKEADKALSEVDNDNTVENIIKNCLKLLMN
jgi:holliday junction DNA helicase RuvA